MRSVGFFLRLGENRACWGLAGIEEASPAPPCQLGPPLTSREGTHGLQGLREERAGLFWRAVKDRVGSVGEN